MFEFVFYILSSILIIVNLLPFIKNQHWFFRVWDFGRIQLTVLAFIVLLTSLFLATDFIFLYRVSQFLLLFFISYNIFILIPYTKFYSSKVEDKAKLKSEDANSIISVNVYQFNNHYEKLITLIKTISPDIVLTMESNAAWEKALEKIENEYDNVHKVALENTYGMHFYSKLKITNAITNYFVADDVPSFEITIETKEKKKFVFFGVHPPPPSPTEEENSKERDGELLSVAKKVEKSSYPVIVSGDFNNVAWANSSILFKKKSKLIDPRIGRGFVSTFHAKYRLLRFPIDLFFHSKTIAIEEFKTLEPIGSDHLPLYCKFHITHENMKSENNQEVNEVDEEEIEEIIEDGKKEKSDRKDVANE